MNKSFDKKYAQYYDLFNTGKDYKKECNFLEKAFKTYYAPGVRNVLNLGCGTGVHDMLLAKRGYNITGLDLSIEMIELAKLKRIPNSNFVVGNMSDFSLGRKYDACISMFAAFGYLTENEQIESAVKAIRNHLRPKGLFIMDCWNGLGVMKILPTTRIKQADIGDLRIIRTSYPKLHATNHVCDVDFDVRVYKGRKIVDHFREMHHMRFLFPKEIRKYFEDGGFEVLELCKDFRMGSKLDENDWNLSFIARLK